jgi:diguanylate cyclase (GGDEF)-like protein
MQHSFRNALNITLRTLEIIINAVRRIDYKALNNFILKTNGSQDINEMLFEVSRCLKEILDYELFGIVIKQNSGLEIWIDPRAYQDYFLSMIEKDFNCKYIERINYLNTSGNIQNKQRSSCNPLSFKIIEGDQEARLYLMPGKKVLSHHNEILDIIIKTLKISLENIFLTKKLRLEAWYDPLTGCLNRRAFNNQLEHDIAVSMRYNNPLSIIMFDIDHFKKINDTYGHFAGDIVLKEIVKLTLSTVRKSDYIARFGGEEFIIVLPNTDIHNASLLAERLRKRFKEYKIKIGETAITITSSFGVAEFKKGYTKERMIQEADEMLYQAKALGRDRVCYSDSIYFHNKMEFQLTGASI